ncbi:hypothetical protein BDW69DRAFT_186913 [Aspergillus filifer]
MTIVDGSGGTIILRPDSIVIGTETIWAPGSATPSPTTIVDDDVTITLSPHSTWSATPTAGGTDTSTGPTPTTQLPSFTSASTTSTPPVTIPPSTILTITATTGSSTFEVTFTPTTLTQYTTLTASTTLAREIDGAVATIVIGPGETSSSSSSSSPSTTSAIPFPSPTATIVTSTTSGPNGPSISTITGTTNSNGILVPITSIPPEAAISSASNLLSEISAVSTAVAALSSDPINSASATAALDAIGTAQADTNDFGSGLGISGPGLWGLFGGSLSGIASALNGLGSAISGVISGGGGSGSGSGNGGSSSSSSLSGPLNALGPLISSLNEDILEAQDSLTPTPPTSTPPPEPPATTSPPTRDERDEFKHKYRAGDKFEHGTSTTAANINRYILILNINLNLNSTAHWPTRSINIFLITIDVFNQHHHNK